MKNREVEIAEAYALHTDKSFFLTGKAGTGKTTLLRKIIDKTDKNVVVVAPTGVAAINASGSTIHSMFGFPLKIYVPSFDKVDLNQATNKALLKNHLRYKADKRKVLQELDLLIIDEISMVRADLLDAIDYALKYIRKNQLPFGGVQVITIGDLFQLSPIARDHDWSILRNYYQSPFFFHSQIWQECEPFIIELKKVYRQEEQGFIDILNKIRNGKVDAHVMDVLNDRYDPDFTTKNSESIILTTHNHKANDINLRALNNLDSRAYKYKAEVDGNFSDSSFPIDEVLTLKKGAQIMFIRNDTEEGAYYNGKLARIERIGNEDIKVRFLDEDRTYYIKKVKWENKVYSLDKETNEISQEVVGSFSQYPVRLAWAITIHKSQGLTFDQAVVDIGGAFAMGQTYVALSRCTNLKGMTLKSRLNERSVRVNPSVVAFYEGGIPVEALEGALDVAKNEYSLRKIRKEFSIVKLKDDLEDWKAVLEKKTIPGKTKVVNLCLQLATDLSKTASTAYTFQQQLDHLFREYRTSRDKNMILERTEKAIGFFTSELHKNLIKPLHKHISDYKKKKGTKAYTRASIEWLDTIWGQVNSLYGISFMGEFVWKGEKLAKEDMPELSTEGKTKGEYKQDTYSITLELYKEGKSVKAIAKEREMVVTTIEGHLAKWITRGEVEITEVLKPARLKKILPFHDQMEDGKLTSFKEAVPFQVSYTELRYVDAYVKKDLVMS